MAVGRTGRLCNMRPRGASLGPALDGASGALRAKGGAPHSGGPIPETPMLARLFVLLAALLCSPARAEPDPRDWPSVLAQARGQTVHFHAWGGDPLANAYIDWAGAQAEAEHGVRVVHVKLSDTAQAVARVLSEKAAGRAEGGAVDLIWINGPNFAAMKEAGLLFGPWAEDLPNWRFVDVAGKPSVRADFTVPTEGLEAPWSMAQLVFFHDADRLPEPPRDMAALLDWAHGAPGRFAYPAPPDFLGTTFLKQALRALTPDPAILAQPVEQADFGAATAPLWAFLDALHPVLWRQGRAWPATGAQLRAMMADGEIDLAFSFNPNEAAAAIADGQLQGSVRAFALDGGMIGNASFVAIPFNASAKAGAMVFADLLLSPAAQARKADPEFWGLPTVLDIAALPQAERALFDAIETRPGALAPEALGPVLPEPHPSWATALELEWTRRYGAGR